MILRFTSRATARVPTVSAALDISIELHAFLLKLDSCFLDLLVSGFQLLHPHVRWGRCLPLGLIADIVRRGSLLRGDAFDVSLGGTRHKTFLGGVMAPPTRVGARV